jgi:trimeric autotransporter adhesin
VGVSASQARAADTAARELITASATDAEAARTSCTGVVASSTAAVNITAYVAAISDALGADSAAAKAAATTHDKPYLIADCAITGAIVELNEGQDPSDNVDAITSANKQSTAAWVALATDVKALDTKVSADLAALNGLAEANTAYTTALTSLQDKLAAAQALTEGDLKGYLSAEQVATLTSASDTAKQVHDVAVTSLDAISPMSLSHRAATLNEAVTALAATFDPLNTAASDAKAADDARAAAEAAAAAAAAAKPAKAAPRSSGSTSSSSSSTGNGSTETFPPASTGGGTSSGPIGWYGSTCTSSDGIKYRASAGWTESSARADAQAKGCASFITVG